MEETPTLLGSLERANLSHWTQRSSCLPPHLRTETHPVSETLCFLVSRIPDDGKSPKNPVILSVIHHRQNPLESTKYNSCFDFHSRLKISLIFWKKF
jgi:hypothetical protein